MTEPRLTLTSTAFSNGAPIPRQYTADGRDVSPPLAWDHVPEGYIEMNVTNRLQLMVRNRGSFLQGGPVSSRC